MYNYEDDSYRRESYGYPEGAGYFEGHFRGSFWVDEDGLKIDEVYWEEDSGGEVVYDTKGESYWVEPEGYEDDIAEGLETICEEYLNKLNFSEGQYEMSGEAYLELDECGGIYEFVKWGRHPDDMTSEFDGSPEYNLVKDKCKIQSMEIAEYQS